MEDTPVQPSSFLVDAPFGKWSLDTARNQCTSTPHGFITVLRGQDYMVKLFYHDEEVKKELSWMKLAGNCSVTPVGRVFKLGWFSNTLCGLVMPHFTSPIHYIPSDQPNVLAVDVTKETKLKISIIYQLRNLVSRLHKNHIIHGDIIPSNLLICSNTKELRLSNFRSTCHQNAARAPKDVSWRYVSPYVAQQLLQAPDSVPVSIERDLYATGVSMWEIYTGRILFGDLNEQGIKEQLRTVYRHHFAH